MFCILKKKKALPPRAEKLKRNIEIRELKNQQVKELDENIQQLKIVSHQMEQQADELVRDGMPKKMVVMVLNISMMLKSISAYMSVWKGLVNAGFGIEKTMQMLNESNKSVPMLIGTDNIADLTVRVTEFYDRISNFVTELDYGLNQSVEGDDIVTKQSNQAYDALLAKHGVGPELSEIPDMSTISSVMRKHEDAVYQ